jgi:hypothetical protein
MKAEGFAAARIFRGLPLRHSAAALHRRQARIRFSPVFIQ